MKILDSEVSKSVRPGVLNAFRPLIPTVPTGLTTNAAGLMIDRFCDAAVKSLIGCRRGTPGTTLATSVPSPVNELLIFDVEILMGKPESLVSIPLHTQPFTRTPATPV